MRGRDKNSDLPAAGRVTDIKTQKRYPSRVSVFIDGEFAFGLSAELCVQYGIRIGEDVDDERLRRILLDEEYKLAENKAWQLLSGRAHSRRELEHKLRRYEFADALIARVLDKLSAAGYLNDLQVARDYVRSRLQVRPMGRKLLLRELQQKGIPDELCEKVLSESFAEESVERELAMQLYAKKKKQLRGQPAHKAREKMARALVARGFSREAIRAVIEDDPDGLFDTTEEHGFTDEHNSLP